MFTASDQDLRVKRKYHSRKLYQVKLVTMGNSPSIDAVTEHLHDGGELQLISRQTGKSLQLINDEEGTLTLNANGKIGTSYENAQWTIEPVSGLGCFRIHNKQRYIAEKDGMIVVVDLSRQGNVSDNSLVFKYWKPIDPVTLSAKLHGYNYTQERFFFIESQEAKTTYLGMTVFGELKPAVATGLGHDGMWTALHIRGKKH